MPLAYAGAILCFYGSIWALACVIGSVTRDEERCERARSDISIALLVTFAGWLCVVISGFPLLFR